MSQPFTPMFMMANSPSLLDYQRRQIRNGLTPEQYQQVAIDLAAPYIRLGKIAVADGETFRNLIEKRYVALAGTVR